MPHGNKHPLPLRDKRRDEEKVKVDKILATADVLQPRFYQEFVAGQYLQPSTINPWKKGNPRGG